MPTNQIRRVFGDALVLLGWEDLGPYWRMQMGVVATGYQLTWWAHLHPKYSQKTSTIELELVLGVPDNSRLGTRTHFKKRCPCTQDTMLDELVRLQTCLLGEAGL